MATFVFTNGLVLVNGVDLSDHVDKVTVTDTADKLETTTMGASNKAYAKGLGDASITIDFLQDFATGKVHQTLQPLKGGTTPFQVEVRAVNAVRSATNPAFVLSQALMYSYSGLDASINTVPKMSCVFENAGNAGMTYPIS